MFDALPTWFAYPSLLGFLAVLPALALLVLYAARRRRRAFGQLGQAAALQKLQARSPGPRRGRAVCLGLGLTLLIVGAAGPRWGRMPSPVEQATQRNLVLVLDVSRSMLAEQPSRQELARRALRNLAATLTDDGGPRLALVIFAAHAQIAFPLTGDYDHLLDALQRIDADDLPPALRPRSDDGSLSGTRIGEALRLALHVLDPKVGGDILLLSDGDDPARDDEWKEGADEARRHHVPVHVVGIGNPDEDATIPLGGGVFEFGGRPVKTRLAEKPLQEIARRSGGAYIPARTSNLPLGKLLPSILARRDAAALAADAQESLPIWQPRYVWFLAPALLLFALALVGRERRDERDGASADSGMPLGNRAPRFVATSALLPLLVALVSAAPVANIEQLLRQGNEAFERGQSEEALHLFEQAEDKTSDPALVAFNKAATLYRLERFGEAALHYQRCLEDDASPPGRRALAYFQMGNAYLRDSKGSGRAPLERALAAYRACLRLENVSEAVRADARHNLELARLLWLQAAPNPEDPPRNDDQNPKHAKPMKPAEDKNDLKNGKDGAKTDEPGSQDATEAGNGTAAGKSKKASSGPLTTLPDQSELVPLSPQETEAHLDSVAQRILQERRHHRRHAVTMPENVKDW